MASVNLGQVRKAIELARELDVAELRLDALGLTVRLSPRTPARTDATPEQARVQNCACGCPPWNHASGICKDHGPDARCRAKAAR